MLPSVLKSGQILTRIPHFGKVLTGLSKQRKQSKDTFHAHVYVKQCSCAKARSTDLTSMLISDSPAVAARQCSSWNKPRTQSFWGRQRSRSSFLSQLRCLTEPVFLFVVTRATNAGEKHNDSRGLPDSPKMSAKPCQHTHIFSEQYDKLLMTSTFIFCFISFYQYFFLTQSDNISFFDEIFLSNAAQEHFEKLL